MARHISNLNIESFRGIKDLELKDLGDINIIVGTNNCGKTSVLEAIMLLSKPDDFSNFVAVSRLREGGRLLSSYSLSFYDSLINMFNKVSDKLEISISCLNNERGISMNLTGSIKKELIDLEELARQSRLIKDRIRNGLMNENEKIDNFVGELSYFVGHNTPLFPEEIKNIIYVNFHKYTKIARLNESSSVFKISFISTIEYVWGNSFKEIIKDKVLTKEVIDILKNFDKNITDLRVYQDDDGKIVQVIDNALLGYMPLSSYGDGVKKTIALVKGIAEAKNGVLVVDEIETSLHASALKKMFIWLVKMCKEFNVQLFMTTHSLEVVDAMLNCCDKNNKNEDLIRVITLVKKENQTVARVLTGEKALQVRDEYDMELRS